MQFLSNFGKQIGWRPLSGWPPSRKSWICMVCFQQSAYFPGKRFHAAEFPQFLPFIPIFLFHFVEVSSSAAQSGSKGFVHQPEQGEGYPRGVQTAGRTTGGSVQSVKDNRKCLQKCQCKYHRNRKQSPQFPGSWCWFVGCIQHWCVNSKFRTFKSISRTLTPPSVPYTINNI